MYATLTQPASKLTKVIAPFALHESTINIRCASHYRSASTVLCSEGLSKHIGSRPDSVKTEHQALLDKAIALPMHTTCIVLPACYVVLSMQAQSAHTRTQNPVICLQNQHQAACLTCKQHNSEIGHCLRQYA
jgi:hypothetical protein